VAVTDESIQSLAKREAEPQRDPIVSTSTSLIVLICTLLLIASAGWALYDEGYGQRPWRAIQRDFVKRYTTYLRSIRNQAGQSEAEIKESPEYQQLDEAAKDADERTRDRRKELDEEVSKIQAKLDAVTDPFQNQRGRIVVITFKLETAPSNFWKNHYDGQLKAKKAELVNVDLPDDTGKTVRQKMNFAKLEQMFNDLRDEKAKVLGEKAELLKEPTELAKKRDDYLKNHVSLLPRKNIDDLIHKNEEAFDYTILGHQISVNQYGIVDRCEICHLGAREPLTIKASDMAPGGPGKKPDDLANAFVSHPRKELLQIHNPEKFGCSTCHGGNGRATTSVVKAHGLNPFWLHPLYHKDNTEAGCQMCHANDRVTQGADTLNLAKDLFYQRGCVGCHRMEAFDRESDSLTNARQQISQLEEQIAANERQSKFDTDASANASDDTEVRRLLADAESLRVQNSQLAARIDELNLQTRYLLQDQKKVGPNLKDVRLKLRKEWIPVWLKDPQAFRPGTKMPTFWRFSVDEDGDDDLKAVAAYLWQTSFDGQVPAQAKGDDKHGKELFESRGCLACHSIGEGDNKIGGTFAANLTKVGEKANYDYIVRWIYNPRERWAPYCPKEHRDLTPEDYAKHGKPFIFDTELNSKCPNDGAELQVQNMTVMPNLRLSEQDARDIATYLFSLSSPPSYPDVSFMDDPKLLEEGKAEIKQYGCAGCHEIKGFEEEQRIGKELTTEGATPLERLDFALLTQDAEYGREALRDANGKRLNLHPDEKDKEWYNHRGFFEHKLADPSIYDRGKSQYLEPKDRLRMPRPFLTDEWRTSLTTLLLGSVGAEGANVPASLFYSPQDTRRQDVQNGWWVIKKYNCMGCHILQPGQQVPVYNNSDNPTMAAGAVLTSLSFYQNLKELLPPQLTSEGARVDPDWLMRFLKDPSLMQANEKPTTPASVPASPGGPKTSASPAATPSANMAAKAAPTNANDQSGGRLMAQPGVNRNGVRPYLQVHMPTFNFSPNELRVLVRFFMAISSQNDPYIKEPMMPMTEAERSIARNIFVSGTPCLKCHITGEPTHDAKAIAPNFLLASERLKPDWTFRWLLDPSQIAPGTAMPTGLFKKDGERWVVNLPNPPADVANYQGDHARLLVRYMFLMTSDEQRRLLSASPAPPPQPANQQPTQKVGRSGAVRTNDRVSHHVKRRL
jgi:cytochrome c551/c552